MKIRSAALLGLGAVGCTLAPGLCRALGEENFYVTASGNRKERLEKNGKQINGRRYFFHVLDPEECRPVDLILVAVKAGQIPQAVRDIRNHVGRDTLILPLMNGVTSEEIFADVYGWKHVLYSLTTISAQIREGAAFYSLDAGTVKFGREDNRTPDAGVRAVAELFKKAEIPFEVPENMKLAVWQKFLFNVSNNGVAAVLHARHFYFQRLDAANRARKMVLREAAAVAAARGIPVTETMLKECMEYSESYPADGYCSMVQDIEAGRPTEKEIFLGDLIRMAETQNIQVPICRFLYELLQAMEDAAAMGRTEHLRNKDRKDEAGS